MACAYVPIRQEVAFDLKKQIMSNENIFIDNKQTFLIIESIAYQFTKR
jgi:hypothetical protein